MTQQLSSDGNEPQSHSKEIESFSFTNVISPSPWVPSSSNGADRPLIAQTDLADGVDEGIEEETIEYSNSSNSVTSEISASSDANHQSIVSANMIDEEGEETSSRSRNESSSIVSAKEGEETVSNEEAVAKDPRIIARKYQLQLSKKAVEENTIVYLGTGCGKTHIAVLVIYELGHLIKKPQKNVCVFLAPTIPLVRQQAAVIEESTDFKVGCYHGHSNRLNNHQEWEKELEKYEVLVMTPQILLRNLSHRIIKMELIALLIFDECHHAQLESSHPYAQIMKEYRRNATKRPRIFGMTASPIVGKGGSDRNNIPKSINSLETLLDSKVYSVDEKEELEGFVAAPKVKCYYYAPTADCNSRRIWREKLEEIKNQCSKSAREKVDDSRTLQNNRKLIQRLHDNLIYCLENLGLWGTVKAIRISIAGDQHESTESMETEDSSTERPLDDQYLSQAAAFLDSDFIRDGIGSDTSSLEALEEPFFSNKLLILIGILTTCRHRPDMKCIIFVNRIVVARTLSYLLGHLKCLEFWKCHFLVGFHSGLKGMSRNAMDTIVQKFRSGELNLLVATSIGEEGLDIQTCCLVIRFDLPQTVASFIQSRGRARMRQSEYAFLVERNNQNEMNLIESFISNEDCMNQEITCRTSGDTFDDLEEEYYEVHSTGASCSAVYSVSLLHEYCSKLPHDEFFSPKPVFNFFDDVEGTICVLTLPSNAPIHEVKSLPQPSKEKAKKTACLKACKELQLHGALTDHLCPGHDLEIEDGSTDSDSCEDESPRGELHEMLVPAVLKVPLTSPISPIVLHYYFIRFTPVPDDRQYQQFGLFVKARLPEEAEAMELDLHLAHGRIVKTLLVYSGMINFDEYEIMQAVNIQEVFYKIILDREDFYSNFVPLEKSFPSKSSTFYLLLPVGWNEQENRFTVDWKIINNCLSSPVFKYPTVNVENDLIPTGDSLILADGPASTSDIVNSLVFIPHNNLFFFIDEILTTDADSTFSDKSCSTYVEHYSKKFKIELKYSKQPLLKAKQLFSLRNLLHNRVHEKTEARELKEHFVEIPPELCVLKIIGFSKDIGSSLSLLPSIMHRLENLLVAIELKSVFSASFVEGSEVTVLRILEAITTEKCLERFSLERLEILGDAFLKYAVGRHLFLLHDSLDEGELTRRRSSSVSNSHLYKLATRSSLQVYIRDEQFDPCQFYAMGRPCKVFCEDKENNIHAQQKIGDIKNEGDSSNIKCSKNHHWLHKKTIADVVEALVGAFIVDCGFKAAIAFLKWIGMQVNFEASKYSKICTSSKIYLDIPDQIDIKSLENLLGYSFLHKGLLVQAFVHPSYNKHSGGCYQRLEFLGDAVLDYLITSYLYSVYPKLKPGQLTDLRSASVNNVSFATVAVARSFHKYLISDSDSLCEAVKKFVNFSQMHPLRKRSVESPTCPKALGDLVESIIGAILLDSGFNLNLVWGIMLSFLDSIMSFSNLRLNPVRQLQELCQACDWDLNFEDSKRGGVFLVHAHVSGKSIHLSSNATHLSKKTAMRKAAEELFLKLKAQGYKGKTKTLEQILKSTKKEEAKLIGFDETPLEAVLLQDTSSEAVALIEPVQLEELNMQENSSAVNNHTPKAKTIGKEPSRTPIYDCFRRKPICAPKERERRNGEVSNDSSSSTNSQTGGFSYVGSAKSRLFDICVSNYWNPPVFECIKDEGPPHLKSFTFKVTVQIEELSDTIIECFSEPKTKKKAAEEHAAEGALWYLWHQGYAPKAKIGV